VERIAMSTKETRRGLIQGTCAPQVIADSLAGQHLRRPRRLRVGEQFLRDDPFQYRHLSLTT